MLDKDFLAAGSEKKSGGFGRRAERLLIQQNALIRREVKVPKGSGGWRHDLRTSRGDCNGPEATMQPLTGANRQGVAELKGRTGSGSGEKEAK